MLPELLFREPSTWRDLLTLRDLVEKQSFLECDSIKTRAGSRDC